MNESFTPELEERLVRYVQIDTESNEHTGTHPSTEKQFDMLHLLMQELKEIGASDIRITEYGTVLATIPATTEADVPTIAFLGHVDTSPGYSGANVKPIVHRNWDGSDIVLPDEPSRIISPRDSAYLATRKGEDIVTASGKTLLGADDKAGVAIVMTMARHLLEHPEIPHGRIRLAFTPDEEIGQGVQPQLPADLQADFAYTLDGAERGEICFETFSGDSAKVTVTGVSIHPGSATGVMVNALHLIAQILEMLPKSHRTPDTTQDRDGFIHAYQLTGNSAEATAHFILRDFEVEELQAHGDLLKQVCATVQALEPRATITCEISKSYRNMRYWLENDMRPVDIARRAAEACGIEPFSKPIRGGTDGSRLTELGVPCPNLFTGMQNLHGPLEWISLQDMDASTRVCLKLAVLWAS